MSKADLRDLQPEERDVFDFLHGLLWASLKLAEKCPFPAFTQDVINQVITPWARLIKAYREILREKEEKKDE